MSLTAATRLGPYEILAPLGSGGMGEVYKGRDSRLERTVAIKILPSDLAGDPQFRDRFDREAKTISALNHPNICTLYDVGEAVSPTLKGGAPAPRFAIWSWNISKVRRWRHASRKARYRYRRRCASASTSSTDDRRRQLAVPASAIKTLAGLILGRQASSAIAMSDG